MKTPLGYSVNCFLVFADHLQFPTGLFHKRGGGAAYGACPNYCDTRLLIYHDFPLLLSMLFTGNGVMSH
jgi:hypothetical protein